MKRRNMFVAAALIGVLALGAMAAAGKLGGRKKDGLKAVAVALQPRTTVVGARAEPTPTPEAAITRAA